MRVESLRLTHFGPFEDEEFEFPSSGVAFLYGLNGDGKTTLTRALIDLLFGIPSRGASRHDGWRFPQVPEIIAALSGLDSLGSGSVKVVRRGGGLSDGDGNDLDRELFADVTKGLDKEHFAGLYSIGHGQLIEGGKRLSAQEGDLGAIVFGVAFGGSLEVKATLEELIEDAGELFALEGMQARGKKVTDDLGQLAEKRAEIEESSATFPEFAANGQAIREKRAERETLERERDECKAGIERLEILEKVLPGVVKLKVLEGNYGDFKPVRDSESEINALSLQLAGVGVQMERLEEFEATLAGNELRNLLLSLGVVVDDEPAKVVKAAGEVLTWAEGELIGHFRASEIPGELNTKLRQLNGQLINGLDDLEYFEREEGESDHDYVERFARLDLPPAVEVEGDQEKEDGLREQEAEKIASRVETERQLEARKTELDNRNSGDEVPDRRSLEAVREERQSFWKEIRSAWVDGGRGSKDPVELAAAYEDKVDTSDQVADALVDQAEAVNIAGAIDALNDRKLELGEEITEAGKRLEEHLEACGKRWNKGGVLQDFRPRSAKVMLDWLSRTGELRKIRQEIFDRAIDLQDRVRQARDDLEQALDQQGDVSRKVDSFVKSVGNVAGPTGSPVPKTPSEAVSVAEALQFRLDENRDIEKEKGDLKIKLLRVGQGTQAADLEKEIGDRDADTLKKEAAALRRDVQAKQEAIDNLTEEIESLEDWKREASALGSAEVKQLELAVDSLEAAIQKDIERFLTLSLVVSELDRAMNTYSAKSAEEVCERAEAIFLQLVEGRFERLETRYEGGNAWITVVRADTAEEVEIDKLADGERDALYLAFRLATLEYQLFQLSEAERPPVILDDVLIGLDNNRVRAGFKCIRDLSKLTQVIFLTHHEHMIELAGEALSKDEGEWSLVRERGNWVAGESVASPDQVVAGAGEAVA